MEVIEKLENMQPSAPLAIALGAFDGLHLGHMKVIQTAVLSESFDPAVFTFQRNPHANKEVITQEDKIRILEKSGVRKLYCLDFSKICKLTATEFIKSILKERCNVRKICCGEDFHFGYDAAGDVSTLRGICKDLNLDLQVVPPVTDGGQKVSSTRIREALKNGKITFANQMLGRPFSFSSKVIHGRQLGRTLGTPTINQKLPEFFVMPKFGVYASIVKVAENQFFYGVTNIGVKPTVGSDFALSETWMPNFSGNLYEKDIKLYLLGFIRPEKKFESLDEMKAEIIENARISKMITDSYRKSELL